MAVFTTSAFLTLLVQTYVWQQYKFQAASCLNSPSLYSDCSVVYPCSYIPSINSVYTTTNGVYGYTNYAYYYSSVKFWGYGRSNLTTLRPTFANASAQAAYSVCAANTTCYEYYQRNPAAANSAILNLMISNLNKIIAILPTDNSRVWYPSTQYANAMSIFTVLPSYDNEIFGTHNAVVLAIRSGAINGTKYEQALQLKVLLSGGASMYESLINTVVLASHTCDYSRGVKKTRATEDHSGSVDVFQVGLAAKMADLDKFSTMRGPARAQVWEMTMSKYKSTMEEATLHKRTCSASAAIQRASDSLAASGKVCAVVQSLYGLFSVSNNVAAIAKPVFTRLTTVARTAETAYSVENLMINIVSGLCAFSNGKGPCYPSVAPWFDPGTAQGLALSAVGISMDIVSGDAPGILIDVSCAVTGIAAHAFDQSAKCCAQNCASPKCSAAGILCAWSNAPC
jgi:hypothetical protein